MINLTTKCMFKLFLGLAFASGLSSICHAKAAKRVYNHAGYSFMPDECWDVNGDSETTELSDHIYMNWDDNKCKPSGPAAWSLGIDPWYNLKISPEDSVKSDGHIHDIVYRENRDIGHPHAVLYLDLTPESYKFIDRKDYLNYGWSLIIQCKKIKVSLVYSKHLDKADRDKARKERTPPKELAELIDGFRCEN